VGDRPSRHRGPSYWSLPALSGLACLTGNQQWQRMADGAVALTAQLTRNGALLPPDWAGQMLAARWWRLLRSPARSRALALRRLDRARHHPARQRSAGRVLNPPPGPGDRPVRV